MSSEFSLLFHQLFRMMGPMTLSANSHQKNPSQVLNQILVKIRECAQSRQRTLVVFDLDSTLFNVGPRLEKVVYDFATSPEHQSKYPRETEILKTLKSIRTDWGVERALTRLGLNQHADKHSLEFQQALQNFWRANFFSDPYLHFDHPFPGAVEFAQKVADLGAEIVYLTGRDIARMATGSREVLLKWNFPLDDKTARLTLKPNRDINDAQFKKDWFWAIPEGTYSHIWFFENEPVNINLILEHLPLKNMLLNIIFFDSTHSGKADPPSELPQILHFLTENQPTNS